MIRPHPLGLTSHPDWEAARRTRDRLILADRARRYAPAKPAFRPSVVPAVLGAVAAAAGLVGMLIR